MSTTLRSHGSGSRRAVPTRPTEAQRQALHTWLQGDFWVLRPVWDRWLASGDDKWKTPLHELTRNQHEAARAWLTQQRHALHDVVASGPAPDDWLESQPLYRALVEHIDADPRS